MKLPMKLYDILKTYQQKLLDNYSKNEIQIIFYSIAEKILNMNKNILKLGLNEENPNLKDKKNLFDAYLFQLLLGKPYQYVIGESLFYGLDFFVNEHVLIPRPETEELVEWMIKNINNNLIINILDIGTGSGCIPIVLKKHLPKATIYSIDISEKALEVAKQNAKFHHQEIHFIHDDFLNFSLPNTLKFDIIVSNPPYIPIQEKEILDRQVVDFEPNLALFVPDDQPFLFYKKISEFSLQHLNKNGQIFLEVHQNYANEVVELFKNDYKKIELRNDISSNPRMIKIE
jgi:release factor glutamine methyltransferase